MKEGRGSATAEWIALARAVAAYDRPKIVDDPYARGFLPRRYRTLVDALGRGAAVAPGVAALLLKGPARHIVLRTRAIDDAVDHAIADGADAFVILGAGFDARAHRLASASGVKVFEVDHPATQAVKRRRIPPSAAAAKHVTYAPCDFETTRPGEALRAVGFPVGARTIVIWEGVTMYLAEATTRATLDDLHALLGPGSRIAFTYLAKPPPRLLARLVASFGEPFRAFYPHPRVAEIARAAGFSTLSDEGDSDWAPRFGVGHGLYPDHERIAIVER